MPQFVRTINHVAELCINVTSLSRVDTISQTIFVTGFQCQVSVTELAVPTAFTAFANATDLFEVNCINAARDFELHGCSRTLTNVPRQSLAFVESTFADFFRCRCSHRQCCHSCYRSRNCHNCCRSKRQDLLAEFFLQHRYPP